MRMLLLLFILFVVTSCSVQRKLPPGERLFGGSSLVLENSDERLARGLEEELEATFRPVPNSKLFGQYWGIWWYYRAQRPNARKPARWMNEKFGEKPVLASELNAVKTETLLLNRLTNSGYFDATVTHEIDTGRRSIAVKYRISPNEPYRLSNYSYRGDSTVVSQLIRDAQSKSLLHAGSRFDLDVFRDERERIDRYLKTYGYYRFHPDFLIFRADTAKANRTYDLYLSIKRATPPEALFPYRIADIVVYPDYAVQDDTTQAYLTDTVANMLFYRRADGFRPDRLASYIRFRPGELYTLAGQESTVNRLTGINNFRYVQLSYDAGDSVYVDSSGTAPLKAKIFLSPLNRRAIRFETQVLAKSNNFAGPAQIVSYQNRNLFKGGEILKITGKFSFETQIAGGRSTGLFAYDASLQTELSFPRPVAPFKVPDLLGYGVPQTRFSLGGSSLNRLQLYVLNSAQLSYGVQWNRNRFMNLEWQPLATSFTGLASTTTVFDSILASNRFLQRSFEQRFILGTVFGFTYSELGELRDRKKWYVQAGLDVSGNLVDIIQRARNKGGSLFGQSYAHYLRFDLDVRQLRQFRRQQRMAMRLLLGYGIPLGSTSSLPYIKQFFVGGPNSVRAFRIRSVGPGVYRSPNTDVQSFYDQAGDIRLEGNLEYRFPISGYLKGAVFIDAGNVWLASENPDLPGSGFTSRFIEQLAVGSGFGLRFDIDFIVVRFDLAIPLRKPWLTEGSRWFDYSFPAGSSWSAEHLILNFGIGYPF